MLARRSLGNRVPRQRDWLISRRLPLLSVVAICLVVSGWTIALRATRRSGLLSSSTALLNAKQFDQRLQQAATLALGDRRGAVIVMDPQTGRVRAIINSKLAFEETFRPGSTIKPFTALAALRSGVIDEDSRTLCHEKYSHEEFHTTCSHPRDLPPLNPTDAIAYSCNYYFGKVGEQLAETNFSSTLSEFGFGRKTGANVEAESQGKLLHSAWHSQNAIGESDYLEVTPIQIINAYSALVNGGRLLTPRVNSAGGFVPEVQANLSIKDEHRSVIVRGMRGAVRYGTAETAGLYSLPIFVFGKTGTATQINGFRTQGWFVGFASRLNDGAGEASKLAPENVDLSVLVFLTKAHGSEAAKVARPIFEEYARITMERDGDGQSEGQKDEEKRGTRDAETSGLVETSRALPVSVSPPLSPSPRLPVAPHEVRVHLVSENTTRTMHLEEYVRGAVAAEGSMEREPEALKALAIASRTYVLKNLGRHAHDGYDFCTTTHCQRYLAPNPHSTNSASLAVVEAVAATRGEILRDADDALVDAYFSASCGGATANLKTLWGGEAPAYLRGVRDEYCAGEAHHSWIDVISQPDLLRALKSDVRTNVGERLLSLTVVRRDASGRAELITIEGDRRLTVKGWDFKLIVGRALGWNYLKSSRFEIARSGSNFVFRGSGFGHGLGLCQEGAHVMAARGATYREILAKYFPGTRVTKEVATTVLADLMWDSEPTLGSVTTTVVSRKGHSAKSTRHTLQSEDFRLNFPDTVSRREAEEVLGLLQSSRKSLVARVTAAGISAQFPFLEIFINESTGDFVGRTGQPPWAAAATKENRIEIQPLATLKRRRIVETTLRHELVHTLIDVVGHGRAPRWLAEGLAVYFAGEGRLVSRYEPHTRMKVGEIEQKLAHAKSAGEMRTAYAAAYSEVRRLINNEGEANVWRRVAK